MTTPYLTCLACLILLPATVAVGQKEENDGPVGVFQSGAEYDEFMRGAKRLAYGPEGSPELRAMIPMLNDIALNQPIGSTAIKYNDQGSTLGMLSDKNIRQEIEMVDGQYEDLKRVNSQVQKRMAEQIRGFDFKNSSDLVERMRSMRDQAQEDLNSVLLPHQIERLRQIRMQSQLRRRSLVDILTSDPVKSDLEITDRQSQELRQAEREIEEDLRKQIAKLRERARDRLLSKLNRAQKDQVEEMIGESFDFGQSKTKGDRRRGK